MMHYLIEACMSGNHILVKELLDCGPYYNTLTNQYGQTGLHYACERNCIECVQLFIEYDAKVNTKDNDGWTPLHNACAPYEMDCCKDADYNEGKENIVKLLLEHGADANIGGYNDLTPLHIASTNIIIGSLLIKYGASVHARMNSGETPLHFACQDDNFEMAKLLIEHGADLEAKGIDNQVPLHYVPKEASAIIPWLLLTHGANLHAKTTTGNSVLHAACWQENPNAMNLFITDGIALNDKNSEGWTALHFAAFYGYTTCAQILLTAGAHIDSKNNDGLTPLDLSRKYQYSKEDVACLELLHAYGAQDLRHMPTPLLCACAEGKTDEVKELLDNGVDVNVKDVVGNTPLHIACAKTQNPGEQLTIIKLLLLFGAQINAHNNYGTTPLHYACTFGHTDIVRYLVSEHPNTDVFINDMTGKDALALAKDYGHIDCATIILTTRAQQQNRE